MKKIRLTESQFYDVIKECVNTCITEMATATPCTLHFKRRQGFLNSVPRPMAKNFNSKREALQFAKEHGIYDFEITPQVPEYTSGYGDKPTDGMGGDNIPERFRK